jgi:hypothetical protein
MPLGIKKLQFYNKILDSGSSKVKKPMYDKFQNIELHNWY